MNSIKPQTIIPLALLYNHCDEQLHIHVHSAANGRITSATRLQKLTFLTQHELQTQGTLSDGFSFIRDEHGPYSHGLVDSIELLQAEGLLRRKKHTLPNGNPKHTYKLLSRGRNAFDHNLSHGTDADLYHAISETAAAVLTEYETQPLNSLITDAKAKHR